MNTLTFLAPSGAPASGTIIEQLDPPGNTSGANYVGFFGAGGPQGVPFAVIVDNYQDRTFITNTSGTNLGNAPFGLLASGELINHRYNTADTTTSFVANDGAVSLTDIPRGSGTLLVRFEPSGTTPVITQNTILRAVDLNASSGINSVLNVPIGVKIFGFEPETDATWTQIAGSDAVDNRLLLDARNDSELIHDFFIGLSASPEGVGQKSDFGFFFIIEFL